MPDVGIRNDFAKGQTTGELFNVCGFQIFCHMRDFACTAAVTGKYNIPGNTIVWLGEKKYTSNQNINIGIVCFHSTGRETNIQVSLPSLTLPSPPLRRKEAEVAPGVGADCETPSNCRSDAGLIARELLIKCFGGCSHVIFLHQAIRDLKVFPSFQSSGLGCCLPLMDVPVSWVVTFFFSCRVSGAPSNATHSSLYLAWPRKRGRFPWGHTGLLFVSVSQSVGGLTSDPSLRQSRMQVSAVNKRVGGDEVGPPPGPSGNSSSANSIRRLNVL